MLPELARGATELLFKGGGKILAGGKAAVEGDGGYALIGLQPFRRGFQPELVEEQLGRLVRDLFAVMHKTGHPQAAALGHGIESPFVGIAGFEGR